MSQMIGWTLTSIPWKHKNIKVAKNNTSTLSEIYTKDLQLKRKAELGVMYPECYSGVHKFKDFEYHIDKCETCGACTIQDCFIITE